MGERRPTAPLNDDAGLLKLMSRKNQLKAYIFRHTHDWAVEQRHAIYMVNLPAVSYYFGKGKPHGWVDMRLTEHGADLQLRRIDPDHVQHGQQLKLTWRASRQRVTDFSSTTATRGSRTSTYATVAQYSPRSITSPPAQVVSAARMF